MVEVTMNELNQKIPVILNLGFRESAIPSLKAYIELLWRANEELNLFSRQMPFTDLINNHLIDCLLPLNSLPKDIKSVADFGSGGGLPGVLYAINFPDVQFHLYEKSPKKQAFLKRCSAIAPNLHVHGEIPADLNGIDLVIARAFKPTDVILEMSRSYYLKGGRFFLLKGRREKIEEELADAIKKFKDLKAEIIPLSSPVLDVERHLVLI